MTLRQAQGERIGDRTARLSAAAAMLLGWRPGEFWDSTPAELAAALRLPDEAGGPDGETLADLMRRFPDEMRGDDGR
jgi:broad specificity phosphatase PhoE